MTVKEAREQAKKHNKLTRLIVDGYIERAVSLGKLSVWIDNFTENIDLYRELEDDGYIIMYVPKSDSSYVNLNINWDEK